jgi:hypothetical protein
MELIMMKSPVFYRYIRILLLVSSSSLLFAEPGLEPQIETRPLEVGTYTDYGRISGGHVVGTGILGDMDNQYFTRLAVWMTQHISIEQRLDVSVGVGGMFWYQLPEQEQPHTRLIKFGPGVHLASAAYSFGDVDNPFLKLRMGYFPHKYNPDAKNLGEYLFRCGTYPGFIWTGGWSILNSAGYSAHGIKASLSLVENSLNIDGTFYIERGYEPNFDISPGLLVSYNFNNVFELGAGIVFSHLLSANVEKTSPQNRKAAYYHDPVRQRQMPLSAAEQVKPGLEFYGYDLPATDTLIVRPTDPRYGQRLPDTDPRFDRDKNITQYVDSAGNGIPNSQLHYYTFQGQKLMVRISINPQGLIQMDLLEPGALKVYAEATLLGLKDYPFYYEKKSERMPVMIGVNIPTFKLLDALALELEYYNSPFPNSLEGPFEKVLPIWALPETIDTLRNPSPQDWYDNGLKLTGNEWHWSMYARKTIMRGLGLYLQVAHDHFRTMEYTFSPSYKPFTSKDEWYWVLRLECGL